MSRLDLAFNNALLADGRRVRIGVADGRIAEIVDAAGEALPAAEQIDIGGQLLVPGFVEGHIHLDTSFYGDKWQPYQPCTNGFDVRERVAFQMENLKRAAPMAERAKNQLDLCIGNGATAMRSHIMISAETGLSHLEAVLPVREAFRGYIDIQLVAFPQSGISSSPGTAALMDEAVLLGCDVVGGLDPATFDRDMDGHLDVVFGIAERRGVPIDIHLHDGGTLGAYEIEQIAARTKAAGLGGRVAVSHAYGLGDLPLAAQQKIAATLAEAGVAIMTNAPGHHGFPPVAVLRAAGVTVFSGSDNIRDSWWPYGDGDMLRRANMIGYRSGFFEDRELAMAFDIVTAGGAVALGLEGYGIAVGTRADFVTLAAQHVPEAVVAVPGGRRVYKGGRLVAENGKVLAVPH
jgi:cytosine deaminase